MKIKTVIQLSTNNLIATCPACGLLCDDISVSHMNNNVLKVRADGCAKGVTFFEQVLKEAQPTINGKATDLTSAIQKVAELLNAANQPLIAGLGTEVQGMRAIMQLADKTGATLDHMHSQATMRNTLVLQNSGWQTTTLTEVKNRVDLLLVIGTDIVSQLPQFFKRVIWNKTSLFEQETATREVVYLGGSNLDTTHGISPNSKKPHLLPCEIAQLPEVIATLNALIRGKQLTAKSVAGIAIEQLQTLADRLKAAKYSVITWSAGAFNFPHAELLVQNITECINALNQTTRAAGLPLTSGDGDTTINNVATWISGYPVRSSYKPGYPEYNPADFSTEKLLKNGEADALVWISTFKPILPPSTDKPLIVIGHPNMAFTAAPDVFIPVRVPGIQQKGLMFRLDSAVTLPLKQLIDSNLPSLSEVISQIEAHVN